MSSWRAVGFDLDDTLFDHTGAATAAVRDFTKSLGFEATPERVTTWFELESEHFERWRAGRISFAHQRRLRLRGYLRSLGTDAPIAEGVAHRGAEPVTLEAALGEATLGTR
ncbi:FMN phosphatase YigB (HAD superfamily) [Microbacterium terrae]|uniref:HAD family hydrolase n=1 Tax=Microbacterium terrae TaxID=69369 RepID=A0A0M2HKC5_9MICO|nr:hypothetical protein [Microbacterium terrae]KJL44802.1 hypothetical protein RS81_00455 [Microbacterium terrae]MBP1077051.1 FMN phosphatase YigB (HAD superfamily) [Microbacterium terrae]